MSYPYEFRLHCDTVLFIGREEEGNQDAFH